MSAPGIASRTGLCPALVESGQRLNERQVLGTPSSRAAIVLSARCGTTACNLRFVFLIPIDSNRS